ncbi:MAG: ATP-binding cassette domain-containing protein, partial [Alphaproteobacteria bacterium]|nr:ATP-binding cassette domain-containing protein [Alphaproteobacteria bacterium]
VGMLRLDDITISIGDNAPLIAGLSVDIAAGSLRLIQGASGSGKSTLLSVISGTAGGAVRAKGDVVLNGRLVSTLDAEDRRIGLMFQDPLLFPHMTVGDNLAFALAPAHRHNRQQHVTAALELTGLGGFADRDPATLSGGQASRVALMRSLLAEPEALLMDEAFSALDPELRNAFGGFVRAQIRDRGIPALLVSHDAADAAFADDGIIHI